MTVEASTRLNADRIAAAVRPAFENVVVCDTVDSTQAWGLRLVDQVEAEEITLPPTIVFAARQRSGSGRGDRSWSSPPGGLYLSLIESSITLETIARLPILAASVVSDALIELGLAAVAVKWPNDVLVDGKKCAGCLVHARHGETRWAVVGIGVNIAVVPSLSDEPVLPATSVSEHLPGLGFNDAVVQLAASIASGYRNVVADPAATVDGWSRRLIHRPGDAMRVRLGDGEEIGGRFVGLTTDGHLRLDSDGRERVIAAGDVVE